MEWVVSSGHRDPRRLRQLDRRIRERTEQKRSRGKRVGTNSMSHGEGMGATEGSRGKEERIRFSQGILGSVCGVEAEET